MCKQSFCGTLAISQNQIYAAHDRNENEVSIIPKMSLQGKHTKRHASDEDKTIVKYINIDPFPRIESHYCRSSSTKEYLDSDLSISKMYNLCVKKMQQLGREPVKSFA